MLNIFPQFDMLKRFLIFISSGLTMLTGLMKYFDFTSVRTSLHLLMITTPALCTLHCCGLPHHNRSQACRKNSLLSILIMFVKVKITNMLHTKNDGSIPHGFTKYTYTDVVRPNLQTPLKRVLYTVI